MKLKSEKLTEEDHKNLGDELKKARMRFGELNVDLERRYGKTSKAAIKAYKIYRDISELRDLLEKQIFVDGLAFSGDTQCYYGPPQDYPPYQDKQP